MIDLTDKRVVEALKSNMHNVFDSPSGKEVMDFLEQICKWYPNITDSSETNDIISRDATRKTLGTIKTILTLSSDQIVNLAEIVQ